MENKTLRIQISLKEDLLEKIDQYCDDIGMTRSGFFTLCAKDRLNADSTIETVRSLSGVLEDAVSKSDRPLTDEEKSMYESLKAFSSFLTK